MLANVSALTGLWAGSAFRIIICGPLYFYPDFGYNVQDGVRNGSVYVHGIWQGRQSVGCTEGRLAVRMHEKAGFKTVDENDEEYIWKSYTITRESKR